MEPEGFHVAMPVVGEEPIPVAAIYHVLSRGARMRSNGPWLCPVIIIWEDGRIVWSQDRVGGGPPYLAGSVDRIRVQKLLDDLDAHGTFSVPAPIRFWSRFPRDSGHADIAIAAGSRRLHMQSQGRQPVLTTPGWDGETDRQFCKLWYDLDSALMSLRPDEGHNAGQLEFALTWLIIQANRDPEPPLT